MEKKPQVFKSMMKQENGNEILLLDSAIAHSKIYFGNIAASKSHLSLIKQDATCRN